MHYGNGYAHFVVCAHDDKWNDAIITTRSREKESPCALTLLIVLEANLQNGDTLTSDLEI